MEADDEHGEKKKDMKRWIKLEVLFVHGLNVAVLRHG